MAFLFEVWFIGKKMNFAFLFLFDFDFPIIKFIWIFRWFLQWETSKSTFQLQISIRFFEAYIFVRYRFYKKARVNQFKISNHCSQTNKMHFNVPTYSCDLMCQKKKLSAYFAIKSIPIKMESVHFLFRSPPFDLGNRDHFEWI